MDPYNDKDNDIYKPEKGRTLIAKNKKERVFEYFEKRPKATIIELYMEFPNFNKSTVRDYYYQWQKLRQTEMLKADIRLVFHMFRKKMKRYKELSDKELAAVMRLEQYSMEDGV